ncbi:MAG: hypothetical protein PPHEINF_2882 [uncultured Paraburkholderia sp.]|nr:MAG: hypothetical protein PPHEINF_2882 [uncultured Paraburkholderia sp.]CAH2924259.1 MAG: hypothetical protein PPHEMADMSA_2771 [uncultured Paraburkholderia sp.]CAH2926263.1 MAG: hypothetical protein PPHERAN_2920 [uncultured Paraburkholderia sp.]
MRDYNRDDRATLRDASWNIVRAKLMLRTATRDRFMQEKSSAPWRKGNAAAAVSATSGLIDSADEARAASAAEHGPNSPNSVFAAGAQTTAAAAPARPT